ncbi:MAG: ABC transporter ATP-binding protein [Actinomycetota bacterium]
MRGLRKSYGANEAVRGVSFDVEEGEIFAFLGPNGAGKTSTVEILEGYRTRSVGEVSVLGFDPKERPVPMRQRIGIVLQEHGLPTDFRVGELLTRFGSYYPRARDAGEVLGLVDLTDKREALVGALSGGERRRLDFALALIGDPDLIFLDEPTTGFDPAARRNSWEVIRNLCRLGKTVFLTTHYMDEAQELADRIAVIADGVIVAEGTPDSIGGRDAANTVIRFSLPPGSDLRELPDLKPASVETGDTVILVRTSAPTKTLSVLTTWATKRRAELLGLSVTQPSLEDVYLKIVADSNGHESRDPVLS